MLLTAALALVLHFTPATENKIEVTMDVEGHPTRMLLDTGAQVSVFRHLQGDCSLESVPLYGAAGKAFAKHCDVHVGGQKLRALCGVNLPDAQEGLLGSDFLGRYSRVVIDYKAHTVELIP